MTLTNVKENFDTKKMLLLFAALLAVVVTLMPDLAAAGTGGSSFDDVWVWLKDNIQGTLGRIICGSIIVIGVIAGAGRGSMIGFATGVGTGIGLYNSPPVLESLVSATVPYTETVIRIIQLSNGL